jgi:hypothetical protein
VREQELGQPNPAVGIFRFVETLGSSFVERIPWTIVIPPAYVAGGNEMAEVVEQVKGHRRTSDTRDITTFIQFAVGEELNPKGNRIVVEAYEADIAQIERRPIQFIGQPPNRGKM